MLRLGRGLLHICRVSSSMPCCMRSCLSDSEEEMVLLGRHVIVGASQRVFVFDPPAMHGTRGLISEAGFEAAPAAARCSWLRFPLVYWGWCILWVSRGWWLAAGAVYSNRLQQLRLWRSWWTDFSVRAMAAAAWHCSLWRSGSRQGIWFLWPTKQPECGGFALMANGERECECVAF